MGLLVRVGLAKSSVRKALHGCLFFFSVSVLFASSLGHRTLLCRRTHGGAACASRLKQSHRQRHRRARYAAYLLLRLRVRSRSPSPILGHNATALRSPAEQRSRALSLIQFFTGASPLGRQQNRGCTLLVELVRGSGSPRGPSHSHPPARTCGCLRGCLRTCLRPKR